MEFNSILKFLKDLARNNDREWFEKNKSRYIESKTQFDGFVADLLHAMIAVDESLAGLDPRKLTFRIYRDVRFSKDKRPYKTNMGASLSASGKKGMGKPGYYLHIEPGNKSFVAAGLYMPMPEELAKVRQEIDYNGDKLKKILNEKKLKTLYGDFWNEDALKNVPKGYDKEHAHGEWLKLKSFIITHEIKDVELTDKNFLKNVVKIMKASKPLNDFLTEAIS